MNKPDIWKEKGIKKTKQRAILMDILNKMELPLPAAQIHSLYLKMDANAWISTTYRTLDLFTEKGIINKIIFLDQDQAQYEFNRHEHKHYAFCKGCKKVLNLESCPVENIALTTKKGNFFITGHRLEVYGYCEECYKKNTSQ